MFTLKGHDTIAMSMQIFFCIVLQKEKNKTTAVIYRWHLNALPPLKPGLNVLTGQHGNMSKCVSGPSTKPHTDTGSDCSLVSRDQC